MCKLTRPKEPCLFCGTMFGIRGGLPRRMRQQLRLFIKRLDMQEVQHTLFQNVDVLSRLNPVSPHHLLDRSFLLYLSPPRYRIAAILFHLSKPIRAFQIHPELRSSIESLSQPLCRLRSNCPLSANELTY